MDTFTTIFWSATIAFGVLSFMLVSSFNKNTLYLQILSGSLMFASSKIGRMFLGLE
jgi:ABC-type Mn2+/Zn2+ transport system permease subunit